MNKAVLALSFIIFLSSCGSLTYVKNILKTKLSIQQIVEIKDDMDKKDNPAYAFEKTQKLRNTRVYINDVKVKDIVSSTNVDYKFCVIVTVSTTKGDIDCYIYSGTDDIFPEEDVKTISKLKKGVSIIDIEGDFSKFFTLLDETFTKIEIINANIDIKKN
ncbi:MAG: hypothetical protein V1874_17645 [Spirochaetota bacterium]